MKFSIESIALKAALTRLGNVVQNNSKIPILHCVHIEATDIRINPTSLDLKKRCVEHGEILCRIPGVTKGKDIHICFNTSYLVQILKALHSDKISLSIESDHSPARLTNHNDDSYLCVVMPMRSKGVW